jgi:hypothetical protein
LYNSFAYVGFFLLQSAPTITLPLALQGSAPYYLAHLRAAEYCALSWFLRKNAKTPPGLAAPVKKDFRKLQLFCPAVMACIILSDAKITHTPHTLLHSLVVSLLNQHFVIGLRSLWL